MPSKNVPPIDVMTVDKTEITLPENTIHISHKGSYDPRADKGAKVVAWDTALKDGYDCNIVDHAAIETDVVFTDAGDYVLSGHCWDGSHMISTNVSEVSIKVNPAPPPPIKTSFGAKLQKDTPSNLITVANSMHLKTMRPASLALDTYAGGLPKALTDYYNAGFNIVQNVDYTNTDGGNVVDYLPVTEVPKWRKNFDLLCQNITNNLDLKRIKIAIGNEPINRLYYQGDFNNYLNQLSIAIEIAKPYGINVVSGAMHLRLVQAVKNNLTGDTRIVYTKQLMDFEKSHDTWACNIHHQFEEGKPNDIEDFVTLSNWLSAYVSKSVMSNEISMKSVQPIQISKFMDDAKEAKYPIYMFWSGDNFNGALPTGANSLGDALNQGLVLSHIGESVRDYLK